MPIPVLLNDVVSAIEPFSNERRVFISRKTGELVEVLDEEASYAEESDSEVPDWMQPMLPKVREALASEDFIQLPDQFDFHEYRLIERFCCSLEDLALQKKLLDAIRGRGAFRRFKDRLFAEDIEQQWYDYRDQAIRALVVDFLEDEGIPYKES